MSPLGRFTVSNVTMSGLTLSNVAMLFAEDSSAMRSEGSPAESDGRRVLAVQRVGTDTRCSWSPIFWESAFGLFAAAQRIVDALRDVKRDFVQAIEDNAAGALPR